MHIVYLGGNPRKHQEGSWELSSGREGSNRVYPGGLSLQASELSSGVELWEQLPCLKEFLHEFLSAPGKGCHKQTSITWHFWPANTCEQSRLLLLEKEAGAGSKKPDQ